VLKEQEDVKSLMANGEHTWESLQAMPLLYNCIKEALRMWPPLLFLMRKLMKDTVVGKYTIPAGDTIFASPAVSMRLDSVFTNPDVYDPDRFAAPRSEDEAKRFSFIGFGGGMHGCIGEQFAYIQIKIVVAELLNMYTLKPVDKELPQPNYKAMVVGPLADTTKVTYTRRVSA
jgi:sterol 14-demethylase